MKNSREKYWRSFVALLYISLGASFSLGMWGASLAFGANTQNLNSSVGTNLNDVRDFSPEWLLVDRAAMSREFFATDCKGGTAPAGATLTLDTNGWVTGATNGACASTLLYAGPAIVSRPVGRYVVLWEGSSAALTAGGDAKNFQLTASNSGNRAVFDADTASAEISLIVTSFPTNYVHNIRVIVPGGVCGTSSTNLDFFQQCASARGGSDTCPTGETCFDFESVAFNRFSDPVSTMSNPKVVFHPLTLQRLRTYRALRFMNFGDIDNTGMGGNVVVNQSDGTPLTYQTMDHRRHGVAPELSIALANVLNADAWFNMPHQASDAYVTSFATLVKNNLNANLTVYVEYTNEAWNAVVGPQNAYMKTQEGCILSGTTWTNCPNQGKKFFAQRTAQIGTIWKNVFGTQASRVVRVLGGFAGGASANGLGYNNDLLNFAGSQAVDVLAIAPYFDIGPVTTDVSTWTLDNLFDGLTNPNTIYHGANRTGDALQRAQTEVANNLATAAKNKVVLVTYEGGQSLVGTGGSDAASVAATDLFTTANSDPRMGPVYTTYFQNWKSAGGQLFMHFTDMTPSDKYGSWGVLKYQEQPRADAPKYDALMTFIDQNPCWWANCTRGTGGGGGGGGTGTTLPLGTVSFPANIANCTISGSSVPTTQCVGALVSCPGVADIEASLKISDPPSGTPIKGTIVLGTGGGGGGFYEMFTYAASNLITPLLNAGYRVIQRSWNDPSNWPPPNAASLPAHAGWLGGPGGGLALACRYATLVNAIHQNYTVTKTPLCVSGNSGGSAEVAYALAHYGSGAIVDFAEPTSGPPLGRIDYGCIGPDTSFIPDWTTSVCEPLEIAGGGVSSCSYGGASLILDGTYANSSCTNKDTSMITTFHNDSVVSAGATYSYPQTKVNFLFGGNDTGDIAVTVGMLYRNMITSDVSDVLVPGAPHAIASSSAGATQIYNDMTQFCTLRH